MEADLKVRGILYNRIFAVNKIDTELLVDYEVWNKLITELPADYQLPDMAALASIISVKE